MADPLSIATGCMSLLSSIGKLSTQIYTFVSETRHARKDMDMVTRELSSLKLCLECLRDESSKITTKYPASLQENVTRVMGNCEDIAKKMRKLLLKYSAANHGNKMQWAVTGRDEMDRLRSSLETHKAALDIALDMIPIALIVTVKEDTEILVERSADMPRIKADTALIPQLLEELATLRAQISRMGIQATTDDKVGQSNNLVLQRFLDDSTAYAETAYGDPFEDMDSEDKDSITIALDTDTVLGNLSNDESDHRPHSNASASDTDKVIGESSKKTNQEDDELDCHPIYAPCDEPEILTISPESVFDFGDLFQTNPIDLSLTSAFDLERKEGDRLRLPDRASAIRHYQRALVGYEKVLGTEHETTLEVIDSLGIMHLEEHNYLEAKILFQRALKIRENSLGPENARTIWTVFRLGVAYHEEDRLPKAEKLVQRAYVEYEKMYGFRHKKTLKAAIALGLIYSEQNNLLEAEKLLRRALEASQTISGLESQNTMNAVENLGLVYFEQENWPEAEKMYRRKVEVSERMSGPESQDTIDAVEKLGSVYYEQKNWPEVEKVYRRKVEVLERISGREDQDTIHAMEDLGSVYSYRKNWTEAEEMHRRILEVREKTLGPQDIRTIRVMLRLGQAYSGQESFAEAAQIFQKAVKLYEEVSGFEAEDTLKAVKLLRNAYENQIDYVQAVKAARRLHSGYKNTLGSEDNKTLAAKKEVRRLGLMVSEQAVGTGGRRGLMVSDQAVGKTGHWAGGDYDSNMTRGLLQRGKSSHRYVRFRIT